MWPFSKKAPSFDPIETNIGNVLKDMGLIDEAQLQKAALLHIQHEERIGETLIALGAITRDQLDHGLEVQNDLRTEGKEVQGQLKILKAQGRKRIKTSSELKAAYQAHAHG